MATGTLTRSEAAYWWLRGNIPKGTAVREGDVVSTASAQAFELLGPQVAPSLGSVWRAVQEQRGKAAGLDGWAGDELFPAKFHAESFASLCLAFEALGVVLAA
ncbi:unnamed protein product, partial [Prorocentrum cordatum]